MNRYIMIRRLRGPAILLLAGVIALLDQTGAIDHFWQWFVPLFLILLGVFMLAERAVLAADGGYPQPPYPGAPYPGAPDPRTVTGVAAYPGQPVANFSGEPLSSTKEPEGGQS
jgi:hypothetical protein